MWILLNEFNLTLNRNSPIENFPERREENREEGPKLKLTWNNLSYKVRTKYTQEEKANINDDRK